MILSEIKLHNIRSYLDESILFPEKRVLLSGDIGSGKSTILIAIEFALFGLKRGELEGNSLLRNGKNEGFVELTFSINKNNIKIRRILKRTNTSIKQDSGYIVINNTKKEGTPIELKSWIFEILGYPKELVSKSKDLVFRYTVYTPQEEMKQILFTSQEERLDTLRRVFNIDKYKRIRENLSIVLRDIRDKQKSYEGMVYYLPEKTKLRTEILSELKLLAESAKELIPKITESKKIMFEQNKKIESLYFKQKEYQELKKEIEIKESEIKNLEQNKLNSEKEILSLQKELTELKKNISKLNIELNSQEISNYINNYERQFELLEKEINEIKNNNQIVIERMQSLKENIKQYSKETASKKESEKNILAKKQELKNIQTVIKHKPDLEKNIDKINSIVEKINNMITEREVKLKTSEGIAESIKDISKCPTCHQDVSEEYKKEMRKESSESITQLNIEIKELNTKKIEYNERNEQSKENFKTMIEKEKEAEKVKAEIEALEKSFSEFELKKNLIIEFENKLKLLEEKLVPKEILYEKDRIYHEIKNKLKQLREEYDKSKEIEFTKKNIYEKELKITQIHNSLNDYSIKRKELFKLKTEFEERLIRLGNPEKEINSSKIEFEKLNEKDKLLENEKTRIITEKNSYVKQKELLDIDISKINEINENILYLNELKIWMSDYFSEMTLVIEKHIMQRVYSEFNELFKKWFGMLIESELLTAKLNDQFTPIIEQNGYDAEISTLSGGEKTSLALAYRLALNKVINDCIENIKTTELIILDEPTDGFSSEQLDKVRDVIDEIKTKQIIIVSHETKIESFVDSIIKIQKNEHISKVA